MHSLKDLALYIEGGDASLAFKEALLALELKLKIINLIRRQEPEELKNNWLKSWEYSDGFLKRLEGHYYALTGTRSMNLQNDQDSSLFFRGQQLWHLFTNNNPFKRTLWPGGKENIRKLLAIDQSLYLFVDNFFIYLPDIRSHAYEMVKLGEAGFFMDAVKMQDMIVLFSER